MMRSNKSKIFMLLVMLSVATWVHAQTCSNMYALNQDGGVQGLVQINPNTGELLGGIEITLPGFVLTGATGMSVDPIDETVYVVLKIDDDTRRLATLDLATGVATDIGELTNGGVGELLSSIAFDDTGVLWGVTGDGANNVSESLFTVDKATAVMTLQTALGNGDDGESIAFNPADGLIYHRSGNNDTNIIFESIDPDTFAITDIPLINLTERESWGLIFDIESGLLLETNIQGVLLSIDPITGEMNTIGSTTGNFRGPIFYPRKEESIYCDGFETAPPPPD